MPELERPFVDAERSLFQPDSEASRAPSQARGLRGGARALRGRLGRAKNWQALTAGALLALGVAGYVYYYNQLIGLEYRIDETWAEVAALQQRRSHIRANLERLMAEHSRFEHDLLTGLTRLRSGVAPAPPSAQPPSGVLPNPEQLQETLLKGDPRKVADLLRQIQVVAEQYPNIGLTEIVKQLGQATVVSETLIADAIARYNRTVNVYTTYRSQVPANWFAWTLGFRDRKFYQPDVDTQAFRPFPL